MKIPQECCNPLGASLKTNGFISTLILTQGLEWSIEMRKIKTVTKYVDSEYCKRYWVTFDGVNNDGGKVGVNLSAWSGRKPTFAMWL